MPNQLETLVSLLATREAVKPHDVHDGDGFLDIQALQARVASVAYNIDNRLGLAAAYEYLGYPDLAAGEAYKALLLIDEALDEDAEFHDEAIEAASEAQNEEHWNISSREAYVFLMIFAPRLLP
jgi:hypothetical protein